MNFNSLEFLLFLPLVLMGYAIVYRRERHRNLWLLAASYFFYMSWNWKYAGLILLSTIVDYAIGAALGAEQNERRRKHLLWISLSLNLGLLAFFKYHNFFAESTFELVNTFGLNIDSSPFKHSFLLPVGISFYTFQTLSYTIDVYRKEIPVERDFPKFALFIAFFPQLVAGPIVRAADFLPQLHAKPRVSRERVLSGTALIFRGLFKKIVIADLLAGLGIDSVFAAPQEHSSLTLALVTYGYAFQIYNDFSGYSDVAIGSARLFGFDFPENFNRPYLSQNVREFWTRWHISLSSWLRDYLYIPLGGNRGTEGRVRINLLLTMLLGGLWHGAAANFVLWGLWHGLLLIFARSTPKQYQNASLLSVWTRRALCFHLIVVSWLLFRISSLESLWVFLGGLASFTGGTVLSPLFGAVLGFAAAIHFTPQRLPDQLTIRFLRSPVALQGAAYAALIVLFAGLSFGAPAFIYFQF